MSGRRIPLFRLMGFQVWLDFTWIILAVLVTWTLAVGLFPFSYPGLSTVAYWWMGIFGALGLFLSIIIHELSHSLVGRRYGLPIKGITLFIFGGVAELTEEPVTPKAEFLTAVVGPVTSIALSVLLYVLLVLGGSMEAPIPVLGVIAYLAGLNLILAVFNMVPAFPLDGGRVLRAALWAWKRNYRWATRVASRFGEGFGLLLILFAVIRVVYGDFIGGMWLFLIGLFVRAAAQAGYQRALVREVLRDVPVRQLMQAEAVAVPATATVSELVDDYFYRYYFKSFPVLENDRVVGMVNLKDIRELPREKWPYATVREVMKPISPEHTVTPDMDSPTVLDRMTRAGMPRLPVTVDGRLVGLLSQTDILKYLAVRLQLEDEDHGALGGRDTHRQAPAA